ncbi:hypothetical protein MRX96_032346 [Rhipicephalus microplus]
MMSINCYCTEHPHLKLSSLPGFSAVFSHVVSGLKAIAQQELKQGIVSVKESDLGKTCRADVIHLTDGRDRPTFAHVKGFCFPTCYYWCQATVTLENATGSGSRLRRTTLLFLSPFTRPCDRSRHCWVTKEVKV